MSSKRIQFGTLSYRDAPADVFVDDFGVNLKVTGMVFQGPFDETLVVLTPEAKVGQPLVERAITRDEWIDLLRASDDPKIFEMEPDGKTVKAIHRKNSRQILAGVQWEIFKKWKYQCAFCGKKGGANNTVLSIDHIVPVSHGGTDDQDNLISACRKCNKRKGSKPIEEFAGAEKAAHIIAVAKS